VVLVPEEPALFQGRLQLFVVVEFAHDLEGIFLAIKFAQTAWIHLKTNTQTAGQSIEANKRG
jgi:hypothetical protein